MRLESGDSTVAGAKKKMEHTMIIPQGVKLDELEGTRQIHPDTKSTFRKKRNTATTVFIVGAIVVAVVLVFLLVKIAMTTGH